MTNNDPTGGTAGKVAGLIAVAILLIVCGFCGAGLLVGTEGRHDGGFDRVTPAVTPFPHPTGGAP